MTMSDPGSTGSSFLALAFGILMLLYFLSVAVGSFSISHRGGRCRLALKSEFKISAALRRCGAVSENFIGWHETAHEICPATPPSRASQQPTSALQDQQFDTATLASSRPRQHGEARNLKVTARQRQCHRAFRPSKRRLCAAFSGAHTYSARRITQRCTRRRHFSQRLNSQREHDPSQR